MTDEKTVKREIRGIDECAKELKAVKLTVLTRNVSEIKTVGGRKIRFITLLDWLLE
jgi:hypothetical protein